MFWNHVPQFESRFPAKYGQKFDYRPKTEQYTESHVFRARPVKVVAFEGTEDSLVRSTGPIRRALETLGRVPLFFYVLQWPVIHILTNLASTLSNRPLNWFVSSCPPKIHQRLPGRFDEHWQMTN